jgi:hypothetical protein
MGTVASPSDVRRGRRKVVEELARDMDPAQREAILTILEDWHEGASEDELTRLVGERMGRRMLKKLRPGRTSRSPA